MRTLITCFLALVLTGCSAVDRTGNNQADLDNVASCFHEAVTVLQAEPETAEDLAEFMQRGTAAVAASDRPPTAADFTALRWDKAGKSLVTASGHPIRCRVTEQSHDNYGPEGTAWVMQYEFFVPGTDCTSRTTIELRMDR